ncbi:zinc-finger domain-containing protein [Paracoccus sp. Z118]|uniref:zinc-finger domain-containing protein n=1 Tax=Paracoccus sp. Z118 TaxID=2851017 RepID=UPI001C2B7F4E|nr:zinc-finger domain-containing protein [Paracoccus sp. Z118]MBV0890983.1 zinc-finger domain-containing protein [Paracoccus sp. Z118]
MPTEDSLSTNQDPAAEPLAPPATQVVTTWKVSCVGDEELGLGHPLVWMAISPDVGFVDCGYCDKRFVIDREHALGH